MQIKLDISKWSTAIVPDQEYENQGCRPSQCPFLYDGECWIFNMGQHPEERNVGNPPPYGCEAIESYDAGGKMGEYTIVQLGVPDLARIGSPRAVRRE